RASQWLGMKYLWDTNIAIYYLQQQFPMVAENFIDTAINNGEIFISVITEIEMLCWKSQIEQDLIVIRNFIKDNQVIELDSEIKYKTAEIRRNNKIKLPDAIIAATALTNNLILITRNNKDFETIPGVQLVNP